MKKTAVIGASENPMRYSNMAVRLLDEYDHEVVALGRRDGHINDMDVIKQWPEKIENLDTLTLYLNPKNQEEHYDYIIGLHPKRIIFNPGTENIELAQRAHAEGIETTEACTLVKLRTNQY